MSNDHFDLATRSRVMKAVSNRNTAPELRLRHRLWRHGLRYRKHPTIADVTPDLAFVGARIAIFVDGCFWHGCPRHYVPPVGNASYWEKKLQRNKARDSYATKHLQSNGWRVVRVWECEINRQLPQVYADICNLLGKISTKEGKGISHDIHT